MAVILETSIGQLTVDLYTEERPRCSKNFLKLCKVKYYNFSLFHSVQHNLVAQTGDPTATGRGGMSVYGMVFGEQARYFDQELQPRIKHTKRGQLSMVNNGNGKHGSQFFITLGESLDSLDKQHTVFGEVAEGLDVLDKLNEAYCDQHHRPYRDIRIFHTVIIDDPFDDPEGLVIPDRSPAPTEEMLQSDRIGVDEAVDDTEGMTEAEVEEMRAEREAKANAQLLEMVGDLPEADVAPPDNVLFVCKLNPVTTDEDLSLIFSRFGPIASCEVIKDQVTGQSLQYAFVEFEDPQHCENAYFKMDNVLIDDRRIHVDFSQSVSKFKHQGKGKKDEKEEKDDDKPRYVLKNQQRTDDRYDLVYEHDFDVSDKAEVKTAKKHRRPQRDSDSDQEPDHKNGKKPGFSNNSKRDRDRERDRDQARDRERDRQRDRDRDQMKDRERDRDRDQMKDRERDTKERKREQRNSYEEEEDRRKDKRKKERSLSPEKDRKKERKKNHRSPSPEDDRGKERKKKYRSPSSDEERRNDRKTKNRSPSPETDRKKDKKRKNRSPSCEEDKRGKDRKKKYRSLSPDEDRLKDRRKREKSPSSDEYKTKEKKKKKKKERSPSSEREGERGKRRRDRSASREREQKKKKKERKERRRSSSSSQDERRERNRR